ncbi:MAG: gliding motility-associated ABC transporter ATP-binding subunit GldA [Gilvibacter sp.]
MSIQVKNISKNYADQKALDDVSFNVTKGEIVGFLGPNGAGKSTLMKILTTYIAPGEGEAIVNEYNVADEHQQVKSSVGYLPEHNPLYLDMYVREFLAFNASIHKVDKAQIEKVITQTGLSSEAHKKIQSLSKGYRQRVGLAKALLHDPSVLILDEPTTGLDPNQIIEIRELIKSISKDKTIFLSTHIMQEVEALCDRVIIINKGKIVADQQISELQKDQDQIIQVAFDYRVEEVALKAIKGVKDVKNIHEFLYELTFTGTQDMQAKVFDFAHDNGLKILQLNQKNKNLEELFISLTNPQK